MRAGRVGRAAQWSWMPVANGINNYVNSYKSRTADVQCCAVQDLIGAEIRMHAASFFKGMMDRRGGEPVAADQTSAAAATAARSAPLSGGV